MNSQHDVNVALTKRLARVIQRFFFFLDKAEREKVRQREERAGGEKEKERRRDRQNRSKQIGNKSQE